MQLPPAIADRIHASPEDLTPRRLLAAQLREKGEINKARFIEIQCVLSTDSDGDEARALRREQETLWRAHRDAWCAELGLSPPEVSLDRGVITGLSCTVDQLAELAPRTLPRSAIDAITLLVHPSDSIQALIRCEPLGRVRHLTIEVEEHDHRNNYFTNYSVEPLLDELLRSPVWKSLRSLTIANQGQTLSGFIESLASLDELRSLALQSQTFTDEDALRLASFSWMPRLAALNLHQTGLSDVGLRAIVTACRGALRDLNIGQNSLELTALEQACCALRIEALGLVRSDLDDASLARLLRLPALAALTRLDLSHNTLGVDALSSIVSLPALRQLTLGSCELTGEQLTRWISSTPMPWRSLDLAHNQLGKAGAAHLASLSWPSLAELCLTDTSLDDEAAAALASAELPSLRSLDLSGNSIDKEGFRSVATLARWPTLRELSVGQHGVSETGVAALFRWPGLASLRRLSLAGSRIDEALAGALASCEHLGALEELELQFSGLEDEGAVALAGARNLESLRAIDLRLARPNLGATERLRLRPGLLRLQASESVSEGHYKSDVFTLARDSLGDSPVDLCFGSQTLTDDDIEALFRSKNLAGLVSLVLGWHGFGERGALALAGAVHLRRLRELCLAGNPVGDRAIEALLRSPAGGHLQCLNLRDCGLTDDTARALAEAPAGERLHNLYLCENQWTAAGLSELVSSPRLRNLEVLHVANTPLGSAGTSEIFERARLPALLMLNMVHTGIDDEALCVLARNSSFLALDYLRIKDNPIQGAGVEALVHSGHFASLTALNLCDCQLDDQAVLAIASSPYLENLRSLTLDKNRITDQGATAIARSKRLPALEILSLQENQIGHDGRKALKRRGFGNAT